MATFLSNLKKTGALPDDHKSFDSFNETPSVPVDAAIITEWKQQSEKLAADHLEKYGEKLVWAIIDGFLMYWDDVSWTCAMWFVLRLDLMTLSSVSSPIWMYVRSSGCQRKLPKRDVRLGLITHLVCLVSIFLCSYRW